MTRGFVAAARSAFAGRRGQTGTRPASLSISAAGSAAEGFMNHPFLCTSDFRPRGVNVGTVQIPTRSAAPRRRVPALEGPPSMRPRTRPVRRSVAAARRLWCPTWPRRGNGIEWSDGRNGSGRSQNVVANVSLESEHHKRPPTAVVGSAPFATLCTVVVTGSHATVLCRADIRMFGPAARCEKVGMTAGTCPMLTV